MAYAYATPDCALGTEEVVIASADWIGLTATDALDFFVVSAVLVAVTVAVALLVTVGAVYIPPLDMLPALADHETAVLLVPCTVAANCCVFPDVRLELVGDTVTVMDVDGVDAVTDTVALAFLVVSAALVAVTVTFVLLLTVGAVKNPLLEMDPAVVDHVTPVLLVPCTAAANCCE
jgi:hypothetical protein